MNVVSEGEVKNTMNELNTGASSIDASNLRHSIDNILSSVDSISAVWTNSAGQGVSSHLKGISGDLDSAVDDLSHIIEQLMGSKVSYTTERKKDFVESITK